MWPDVGITKRVIANGLKVLKSFQFIVFFLPVDLYELSNV